jgi:hypothetical protein
MEYGQSYNNLSKKAKQFHSVVGLDLERFDLLKIPFNKILIDY